MLTTTRLRSLAHRFGLPILALFVVVAAVAAAHVRARAFTNPGGPGIVLQISPTTVKGGNTVTGTLSLRATEPGPIGGVKILLHSSNTAVATVPSSVYLPVSNTGFTKVTFPVTTHKVTSTQRVAISANNSILNTTILTVTP